jgi:hypothetical protein
MSDSSQGPGWWEASDGKWYPPEAFPAQPYPSHRHPPQAYPAQAYPPYAYGAQSYSTQAFQPSGPPGPKKFYQQVWFWVLVAVVIGLAGCVSVFAAGATIFDRVLNAKHTVVYTITGSGEANITYVLYSNIDNGAASDDGVALPWTKTVTGHGLIGTYNVSATLVSGTSIACKITIDGIVTSSESSTGIGTSVDCTSNA